MNYSHTPPAFPLPGRIVFQDIDDWVKAYEWTARYNQLDNIAMLVTVAFALARASFVWFKSHEHHIDTWENIQAFSMVSRVQTANSAIIVNDQVDCQVDKSNDSKARLGALLLPVESSVAR